MAVDILAGFASLLLALATFLLIGWLIGSVNLYRKIYDAVNSEALPRRWLLLCLFPGFGHWFFRGYQENWQPFRLLHKEYEMKVTRDVSDASWLIIQEHIDDPLAIRKGSTLTALKSNIPFYSFQEVNELPAEDSSIIRVTTPRKSYDEPEWARMLFKKRPGGVGESGWVIENRKSNVPILIRLGKAFYSIDPDMYSEVLRSNTKLYMGTTTYSLIKLPDVGIRSKASDGVGPIVAGISFMGTNKTCNIYISNARYPLVAIFDSGNLTVFGETSIDIEGYSGNTDKDKRTINSGKSSITYRLFIGDCFTIEGAQFIVDCI